jgi:hypothetical protein
MILTRLLRTVLVFLLTAHYNVARANQLQLTSPGVFQTNGTALAILASPEMINKLDENILEVYYIDQNSQGQPVKYIRRFKH